MTATTISLSQLSSTPLTWLWPNRIPLGHLTLLDAAPGCGLSLFTLTLAAALSRGTSLPGCDGSATSPANILLIAPYATAEDTILPRFVAADGDPTRLILYRPLAQETPQTTVRYRCLDLPRDLDHLGTTLLQLDIRLLIIDPAASISGLTACLPALSELARHTRCAILLTRSLRQAPTDPLHAPGPVSALLDAVPSRLLLTADPSDDRHSLLLTTKHSLCGPSSILSYHIQPSETAIPTLHWRDDYDRASLARLVTGPMRSPQRLAILRFLHDSTTPQRIKDILAATSYDYDAGRKMLQRMTEAGELLAFARGLYITANHPCLATFIPPEEYDDPFGDLYEEDPEVAELFRSATPYVPTPHSPTTTEPAQSPVPNVPIPDATGASPQPAEQGNRPPVPSPASAPLNSFRISALGPPFGRIIVEPSLDRPDQT